MHLLEVIVRNEGCLLLIQPPDVAAAGLSRPQTFLCFSGGATYAEQTETKIK